MNICLLAVALTDNPMLKELIEVYLKRLNHYVRFELKCLPAIKNTKNLSKERQCYLEGQSILQALRASDRVVLLDERGKQMKSTEFAQYMQKQLNAGGKKLVFVIGGLLWVFRRHHIKSSRQYFLSNMTFSHQMVRLFMVEQCYRAFSILRGEPYHHE